MYATSILWFFLYFYSGTAVETSMEITDTLKTDPRTLAEKIAGADWELEKVSDEIAWKYEQFDNLFSSVQSITVLEVDLNDEDVSINLPHVEAGFIKTSEAGQKSGAAAAINGSFFDTKIGGSVVFLKKDGKIINPTCQGFTPYRENSAFIIDATGEVSIVAKPIDGWESLEDLPNILVSGPMLMVDGRLMEQVDQPFNTNRHPRTAVGLTADGRLLAVVVDGRNAEAHGMSIGELAQVMLALGCVQAMNLDGGGSSTAWVKDRGVVNYPSDNKLYDHEGERAVATVLAFIVEE